VLPPLRAEEDRLALIEGLKDGTLDFVCSDHTPEDIENKEVEFDQAAFGAIGVETLFPLLNSISELSLSEKIDLISTKPRNTLGIIDNNIKIKSLADITLFNPSAEFTYDVLAAHSKSKNTPVHGKQLTGQVYGLINQGILSLQS
jgi:dihydroorotase